MTTLTFTEKVLSATEEQQLALAIEAGLFAKRALTAGLPVPASDRELGALVELGAQAYERFVAANLRLVTLVTFPVATRSGLDADDLFQEGVLGLVEAVQRFDHRLGCKFATFALPWIRMRVNNSAVTRCGAINLPPSRAKAWVQVVMARDSLTVAQGRPATVTEIARHAKRSPAQVRELLGFAPATRLGEPTLVASPVSVSGLDADAVRLHRLLRRLDGEQRVVIDLLYGLGGGPVLTYDEVGEQLDLSVSTVRRRERLALDALRRPAPLLTAA